MEDLIRPEMFKTRILRWADEEIAPGSLPKAGKNILKAIVYRWQLGAQ